MRPKPPANYLAGYPIEVTEKVARLIASGTMPEWLLQKYPAPHTIRTDKALYQYVVEIKGQYLRKAGQLSKVVFDNKLHIIHNALGVHSSKSLVQGGKLKARQEIHISNLFREMPIEFLRMIVVHELAHIKERQHDKAFYNLCQHMEPDYHMLEFHVRVYLSYLESGGEKLWLP